MNSGSYLLGSVTVHYRKELKQTLGETPDGPTVLVYLMQSQMILLPSMQRACIKEFEEMSITDKPGENVRLFNLKLTPKIEEIVQLGDIPRDLALLTVRHYLPSQVPDFVLYLWSLAQAVEIDTSAYIWEDIL